MESEEGSVQSRQLQTLQGWNNLCHFDLIIDQILAQKTINYVLNWRQPIVFNPY